MFLRAPLTAGTCKSLLQFAQRQGACSLDASVITACGELNARLTLCSEVQ
jgi:hypothetical protein